MEQRNARFTLSGASKSRTRVFHSVLRPKTTTIGPKYSKDAKCVFSHSVSQRYGSRTPPPASQVARFGQPRSYPGPQPSRQDAASSLQTPSVGPGSRGVGGETQRPEPEAAPGSPARPGALRQLAPPPLSSPHLKTVAAEARPPAGTSPKERGGGGSPAAQPRSPPHREGPLLRGDRGDRLRLGGGIGGGKQRACAPAARAAPTTIRGRNGASSCFWGGRKGGGSGGSGGNSVDAIGWGPAGGSSDWLHRGGRGAVRYGGGWRDPG